MLRSINKPCLAEKYLSLILDMVDFQRSAPGGSGESLNVELQANGRRKILVLILYREGMTYDLHTS